MKRILQVLKAVIAIGLLAVSNYALAVPTLNFGGDIFYDTTGFFPADLNITGNINGFEDLSLTPDLATSSVSLFADFISVAPDTFTTTGSFGTTALLNDLLIEDTGGAGGSTRTLLTGAVGAIELTGPNGFNIGNLTGTLLLNGGLLADEFGGVGALIAFNFNLDTVFGSDMFNDNFTGKTNGFIEGSVPGPMPLALFCIGLLGMSLARKIIVRVE